MRDPVESPRVLVGGVLLRKLRVDDRRHRDDEVRHGQLVELLKGGFERVIVDHRELFRLYQRSSGHLDCREAACGDRPVERPFDVLGGHRRAVVEGRILAQVENIGLAVVGDLPALGQLRRRDFRVIGNRAVWQRLLAMRDEPVIGLPVDHAAVIVGGRHHRVEAVRPHFRDDDQRIFWTVGRKSEVRMRRGRSGQQPGGEGSSSQLHGERSLVGKGEGRVTGRGRSRVSARREPRGGPSRRRPRRQGRSGPRDAGR